MTSRGPHMSLSQVSVMFDMFHLGSDFQSSSELWGLEVVLWGLSPWAGCHLPCPPNPFSAPLSAVEPPLSSSFHSGSAKDRTYWRSEEEQRVRTFLPCSLPTLCHVSHSGFISLPKSVPSVRWSNVTL